MFKRLTSRTDGRCHHRHGIASKHYDNERRKAFRIDSIITTSLLLWVVLYAIVAVQMRVVDKGHEKVQLDQLRHRLLIKQSKMTPLANDPEKEWRLVILASLPHISPAGDIVHVIHTPFVLDEGSSLETGLARAKLFRTFCFMAMTHQTHYNFLWIIRTDESVHPEVLSTIQEMIRPYPHFILLKNSKRKDNQRFRDDDWEHIQQSMISGNVKLAHKYHQAAKTSLVLETCHDAEEALHRGFVEEVQQMAKDIFLPQLESTATNGSDSSQQVTSDTGTMTKQKQEWIYFCANNFFEWFPERGEPLGGLDFHKKPCLSSALTVGYAAGVDTSIIPSVERLMNPGDQALCSEKDICVKDLQSLFFGFIRARTPVSMDPNKMEVLDGIDKEILGPDVREQIQHIIDMRWSGKSLCACKSGGR